MKKLLLLYFAAFIGLLSGCGTDRPIESNASQKPQETNLVQLTPAQRKNAKVETGKPEQKIISTVLQVNGMMEAPPQNVISVSVPLGGYLKQTTLLPGKHLKKGQLMAELEDQAYITAKARLGYLEQEFNRQRDLNQSKASSDKVFQQTKADYESQQVLLRALGEKLRMVGVNRLVAAPECLTIKRETPHGRG